MILICGQQMTPYKLPIRFAPIIVSDISNRWAFGEAGEFIIYQN